MSRSELRRCGLTASFKLLGLEFYTPLGSRVELLYSALLICVALYASQLELAG